MIEVSATTSPQPRAIEIRQQFGRKFDLVDLQTSPERGTLWLAAMEYASQYAGDFAYMQEMRAAAQGKGLSTGQAKGVLNCLYADWRRAQQAEAPRVAIEDAGVYVLADGSIARVQANKAGSGTYAKRWVHISGLRLTEAQDEQTLRNARAHGEYEFAPGLVQEIAQQLEDGRARRMNLQEARRFTLLYKRCARCRTTLKAADSVERGIGPWCKTYFSGGATGAGLLAAA